MEWNENFNTGLVSIDAQHKELVHILNRLQSAIHAGGSNMEFGKTIKALVEYAKFHFAEEESILESAGYPDLNEHKAIHANLITEIRSILVRLKKGTTVNPTELMLFLNDWLGNHLLDEDLKIGKYMHQHMTKPHSEPTDQLGSVGDEITARLHTVAKLLEQELLTEDECSRKRRDIFAERLKPDTAQEPAGMKMVAQFLDAVYTDELITEREKEDIQREIFGKVNIDNALDTLPGTEEKLGYLKWLRDKDLLESEEFEKRKAPLIESI